MHTPLKQLPRATGPLPIFAFALVVALVGAGAPACSGSDTTSSDASAPVGTATVDSDAGSRLDGGPTQIQAPCPVFVDAPAILPRNHVAIGTAVQYDSNPPSSGPHYPIWAAYQTYAAPVDLRYLVHNLEHGAVLLLYQCNDDPSLCAGRAAALQSVSDALTDDAVCAPQGVRVRTIVAPDPQLLTPIGAAAWGWTYQADCIDLPSLQAFAAAHYGQGPELICTNGTTQF